MGHPHSLVFSLARLASRPHAMPILGFMTALASCVPVPFFFATCLMSCGYAFGAWRGFLVAYPSAVIGASIGFAFGRALSHRSSSLPKMPRSITVFADAIADGGLGTLILLRLTPMPVALSAAAFGTMPNVSMLDHSLATAIGFLRLIANTTMGAALNDALSTRGGNRIKGVLSGLGSLFILLSSGQLARLILRRRKPAGGQQVSLSYLARPAAGMRTGRNVGEHSNMATDLEAVHVPVTVPIADLRKARSLPTLDRDGFVLLQPGVMRRLGCGRDETLDYSEASAVARCYAATRALVQAATGADAVYVFDHTLRVSGTTGLNSLDGKAPAGAVLRVHGDYTVASGPARLARLMSDGVVPHAAETSARRFCFVNVWRSIDAEHPVLSHPLALCRPQSIDYATESWSYYMHYADRIGQNLAVDAAAAATHSWGYFPQMREEEALLFVTYDSECHGGPHARRSTADVGVVHSAFDDPSTPAEAPPRRSIELRTVAVWEKARGGKGSSFPATPSPLRTRGSAEMQPLLTTD